MKKSAAAAAERPALARDPLSAEDILSGFYRPLQPVAPTLSPALGPAIASPIAAPISSIGEAQRPGHSIADRPHPHGVQKKPKPSHYKIVCISLYVEDIERLDTLVAELKRRGHTKANKSQVIRAALEQIDLDKVPKAH